MSNVLQIDRERMDLILDAAYEADKIARTLPNLVPLDGDQTHYAVKAMAGRLLRLTSVFMSTLSEDEMPTKKMAAIVQFDECGTGQG